MSNYDSVLQKALDVSVISVNIEKKNDMDLQKAIEESMRIVDVKVETNVVECQGCFLGIPYRTAHEIGCSSSQKFGQVREEKKCYSFHQLSSEYQIKYRCTNMAVTISRHLLNNGPLSDERLHQIFKSESLLEYITNQKIHSALDMVDTKNLNILSRDTVSIPGMQIEGPALIKNPRGKNDSIQFFHVRIDETLKKRNSVGFVVCGGSASFGGTVSNKNGEKIFSFLDTHKTTGSGAMYYRGTSKIAMDQQLGCVIVDQMAPFMVLVFV